MSADRIYSLSIMLEAAKRAIRADPTNPAPVHEARDLRRQLAGA